MCFGILNHSTDLTMYLETEIFIISSTQKAMLKIREEITEHPSELACVVGTLS